MTGNETTERPSPSSSLSNYYEWNPQLHLTLVFIAVTILLVNIPVVFVFLKMPSLRFSTGNTFLFGLAIADILCSLVMIPSGLLCELGLSVFSPRRRAAFCRFYYVMSYTISVATVYHIIEASVAKYFAIVFPMKNITSFTTSRVKYNIFAIWMTSFVIGHVPIYWPYMSRQAVYKMVDIHGYFLLVFVLFIPTIILVFIHLHIYFNLFMRPRGTSLTTGKSVQGLNNRKIIGLFLLLFLVFLICWLPWYLINISWLDHTDDFLITLRFLAQSSTRSSSRSPSAISARPSVPCSRSRARENAKGFPRAARTTRREWRARSTTAVLTRWTRVNRRGGEPFWSQDLKVRYSPDSAGLDAL